MRARHRELPSLCAAVSGLNVHAAVCVPARDPRRLERLCRYAGRPPVSTARLSRPDDGRLLYQLTHRWRDGTTHVVFEPLDFIAKLAALAPPPLFHLVRYHGVLAPCASERDRVVPAPPRRPSANDASSHSALGNAADSSPHAAVSATPCTDQSTVATSVSTVRTQGLEPDDASHPGAAHSEHGEPSDREHPQWQRRYSWPELMKRVFALEALVCERCPAPTRIIADIHSPSAIRAILECLGLPARTPPVAAARGEEFDALSAEDDSRVHREHDGEATSSEE